MKSPGQESPEFDGDVRRNGLSDFLERNPNTQAAVLFTSYLKLAELEKDRLAAKRKPTSDWLYVSPDARAYNEQSKIRRAASLRLAPLESGLQDPMDSGHSC